jgi:hypothetical protein
LNNSTVAENKIRVKRAITNKSGMAAKGDEA